MEKTLRELAEYLHGTLENEDQKLIQIVKNIITKITHILNTIN